MSGFLTEHEIAELVPSEFLNNATPIPTQIVSSDEYTPPPQSEKQKEVGHRRGVDRLAAMADRGFAPAGNSRGHAEEIRLQAARRRRRPDQDYGVLGTNARLYNFDTSKRTDIGPNKDRFAALKDQYEKQGPARSNLRYGYVRGPVDWSAFA